MIYMSDWREGNSHDFITRISPPGRVTLKEKQIRRTNMTFYSGVLQRNNSGVKYAEEVLCRVSSPEQREALDAYFTQTPTDSVQQFRLWARVLKLMAFQSFTDTWKGICWFFWESSHFTAEELRLTQEMRPESLCVL